MYLPSHWFVFVSAYFFGSGHDLKIGYGWSFKADSQQPVDNVLQVLMELHL